MGIGIGGGIGPVRVRVSTRGVSGRVGPVSGGSGWGGGGKKPASSGPGFGFTVAAVAGIVAGFFVLAWPWLLIRSIARKDGASLHGQHVAAWIAEGIYLPLLVIIGFAVLLKLGSTKAPTVPAKATEPQPSLSAAPEPAPTVTVPATGVPPLPTAQSTVAPAAKDAKGEHRPPAPKGEPLEPWGRMSNYLGVAGESHHRQDIAAIFKGDPAFKTQGGARLEGTAVLVPDPDNPHGDGHAVAVFVNERHVGYVPHEDSKAFYAAVAAMTQRGNAVTVEARVWGAASSYYGAMGSVTLRMPDPSEMDYPATLPDADNVVILPPGSPVQITGEEDHLDALLSFVGQSVAVTLHTVAEQRARSTVDLIEVRLDGDAVGRFTPTTTKSIGPLVSHVEAVGGLAVARARVVGNSLKADVTVYVAKAANVPQEWLDAL